MVFLVLIGWAVRSGTTLLQSKNTPRVPGLHVPINPPSLFIWRTLCYAAGFFLPAQICKRFVGVWGAITALVIVGIDNSGMYAAGSPASESIKRYAFFFPL